ncbi:hypothetical protein E2C01_100847 [Portunus trituberculatus]|uniref:Uncharacterized protein n=1 Tax=Portunus trituberculatus TaxID=210409 RepID=A0A5B7KIY7_PORTR|nr:hypothetical protein [Portunus trituberculatus]
MNNNDNNSKVDGGEHISGGDMRTEPCHEPQCIPSPSLATTPPLPILASRLAVTVTRHYYVLSTLFVTRQPVIVSLY